MRYSCRDIQSVCNKIDLLSKRVEKYKKKLEEDDYKKNSKTIKKYECSIRRMECCSNKRCMKNNLKLQRKLDEGFHSFNLLLEKQSKIRDDKAKDLKNKLYKSYSDSHKDSPIVFSIYALDIIISNSTSIEKFRNLRELLPAVEYEKFEPYYQGLTTEIKRLEVFYKNNIPRYAYLKLSDIQKAPYDTDSIISKRSLNSFNLRVEIYNTWKVEKTYVKLLQYISTTILYFLMKYRPLHVCEILQSYSINTGTKVCELDTKEGIFYIEPELKISIAIIEDNYEILKKFKHPMNIIYNRSIERIDDFVANCTKYIPLLDLNSYLYRRIVYHKLDLYVDDFSSFINKTNRYMKKEQLKNYRRVCMEFENLPSVYPSVGTGS